MKIVITLFVAFIISFLLIFTFVYRGNKQEPEKEKDGLVMVTFVSVMLALLPTVLIGIILFILLGSANTFNMIFSLDISTNQLIVLAISLLIYLFTIDSIIEIIMKYILGKNIFFYSILLLIRIFAFYVIGRLIGLNETVSITVAAGVTFIILLIETLYILREKNKYNDK